MKIGNIADKDAALKSNYANVRQEDKVGKEQKGKGKVQSVHASALNLFQNGIEDKRKKAMQDAMEFVKQQFASDSKVDEVMDECREQIAEGKEGAAAASEELKAIREQKAQLEEEYSDKDNEDYQAYKKDLDAQEKHWQKQLEDSQSVISSSSGAIRSVKQEIVKQHGMTDALKAEEDAMEAASKEIIGALLEEAKDTVEEKLEETVEKAEEAKEEKEEVEQSMKEAQLEREKKAKEIEEELEKQRRLRVSRPNVNRPDLNVQDALGKQQEILENTQQILAEQFLLPEEIKGIVVDFNL